MSQVEFIDVKTAKFSPLLVSRYLVDIVRYFFSTFSIPELQWDEDPKKTGVLIDTVNNIINIDDEIQKKPRILIKREAYVIDINGLTDNMTSAKPFPETGGRRVQEKMNMVTGGISVIIEGYSEGTVELLADVVSTLMTWATQDICNTFAFHTFGYPMSVSETSMDMENTEKFKIILNTRYTKENRWCMEEDAFKLKKINLTTPVIS